MRTIILYASKHGATQQAAHALSDLIDGEVHVASVTDNMQLTGADCVILGSAIYAGKPLRTMQKFCLDHGVALQQSRIGLFVCALATSDIVKKELRAAYPPELYQRATITACFGGAINPTKLSTAERAVLALLRKSKPREALDENAIERFAHVINAAATVTSSV